MVFENAMFCLFQEIGGSGTIVRSEWSEWAIAGKMNTIPQTTMIIKSVVGDSEQNNNNNNNTKLIKFEDSLLTLVGSSSCSSSSSGFSSGSEDKMLK